MTMLQSSAQWPVGAVDEARVLLERVERLIRNELRHDQETRCDLGALAGRIESLAYASDPQQESLP
jgi:hypothetical protein